MEKESEKSRFALRQPCGIVLDVPLCRSALVLTRDPGGKRPAICSLFNGPNADCRADYPGFYARDGVWKVRLRKVVLTWELRRERQWSDLAIERTTPLLFGLYSLVTLFGHALHPDGIIPIAQAT